MKTARDRMPIAWFLLLIAAGCGRPPAAPDQPAGGPVIPASPPAGEDEAGQPGVVANDTPPKATALSADAKHLGRTLSEWVTDLSNPDAAARSQAAEAVARYGPNGGAAVPALAKILTDPEDPAWSNAGGAVRAVGPSAGRAVDTLVRLLRDRRPWVRLSASITVSELGPAAKRAVPELIVLLDDNTPVEGSSVREAAAAAIVKVGKYDIGAVFEAERKGKLPDLTLFSVLRSLAPDDVESVGGLVDEVRRDDVTTVFDALDGLERIGPKAASALPVLRTLHGDKKHQWLRESLAKTISAIERHDTTPRVAQAQPAPRDTAVEDMSKTLAAAGFDGKADWGRHLTPFVRFGTKAKADQHLKGDRFDKIDVEKATAVHREEVRTRRFRVTGLKFRPVVRSDIETRGLTAELDLPLRVRGREPFSETPAEFSGVLAGLSPCDLDARQNYFLTKDNALRPCTPAEARKVEQSDGVLYHPEVGQTTLVLVFQDQLEVLKKLAREANSFSVELELSELGYSRPIAWGYYQKSAYQANGWDCQKLWVEYLRDRDNPQPVYFPTAFLDTHAAKVPHVTHGRLDALRLKDADGKVVGGYRTR